MKKHRHKYKVTNEGLACKCGRVLVVDGKELKPKDMTLPQILCNCYCLPRNSNKVIDAYLIEDMSTAIRSWIKEVCKELCKGKVWVYKDAINDLLKRIGGE